MILLSFIVIGLLVGILIGMTSLGGFLITVTLILMGSDAHWAASTGNVTFLAIAVTAAFYKKPFSGQMDNKSSFIILFVMTLIASFLGVRARSLIDEELLLLTIGGIITIVFMMILLPIKRSAKLLSIKDAFTTGGITGFFSAITGTSGPMVLSTFIKIYGVPVHRGVIFGQMIQLPVGIGAAVGLYGNLTLNHEIITVAVSGVIGFLAGKQVKIRNTRQLSIMYNVILLISGIIILLKGFNIL